MAYTPPARADFAFVDELYTPATDFAFNTSPGIVFLPPPSVINSYSSQWEKGAKREQQTESTIAHATRLTTGQPLNANEANPSEVTKDVCWRRLPEQQLVLTVGYKTPAPSESLTRNGWVQVGIKDGYLNGGWDHTLQAQDSAQADQWSIPAVKDREKVTGFFRVDEYREKSNSDIRYQPPFSMLLDFGFKANRYSPTSTPSVYFQFITQTPRQAITPADRVYREAYHSQQAEDAVIRIPWGLGTRAADADIDSPYQEPGVNEPAPDPDPKPEPQQPSIRDTYLFMNTINIVTLPDRVPLDLRTLDISLDIDSFAWAMTGELWGASSLAQVEPDSQGIKQIEVEINGWQWVFMIERYDTVRAFNEERYTIYGSSRTSLLAAPYAPMRSKSSTTAVSAKQAAGEELDNTGFTLEWLTGLPYTTPDWIIPGNTFSYQNQTAMQVITTIASTAGAVVLPAMDQSILTIQPRYAASPWKWNETTMDAIVPASMVLNLSASWQPEPDYNAVYVSGTYAGVSVNVKRQGSAGDNLAPDIFEDWLTETQINTERGRNELAKGGQQSIINLELPLTDTNTSPGLVLPGYLVEVQDITGNWRALCLSVTIQAGDGRVSQSIALERHY